MKAASSFSNSNGSARGWRGVAAPPKPRLGARRPEHGHQPGQRRSGDHEIQRYQQVVGGGRRSGSERGRARSGRLAAPPATASAGSARQRRRARSGSGRRRRSPRRDDGGRSAVARSAIRRPAAAQAPAPGRRASPRRGARPCERASPSRRARRQRPRPGAATVRQAWRCSARPRASRGLSAVAHLGLRRLRSIDSICCHSWIRMWLIAHT